MSSAWGVVGGSLEVIYSVSKAGMDGLTKALAKELGPSNIRVNSIAPGMIYTQMNSKFTERRIRPNKGRNTIRNNRRQADRCSKMRRVANRR